MSAHRHALITGFPGFIARRLLTKLVLTDDALRVTGLVAPGQADPARAAIAELDRLHPDSQVAGRVEVVVGDVTATDLGLPAPTARGLLDDITEIHHLAAVRALDAERRRAERVNVLGTEHALAFGRAARRLERFVHFSSAFVSGDRTGVVMEDELEVGQQFRNPYERTKHDAELRVRGAAVDLPVTIIRPAGVVGDSRTGEIDQFDSIYHLAMLIAASPASVPVPLAGDGHAPLNLVPVDYLVDAVQAICAQDESVGRTYHVVDPNPLSARRVYDTVAEHVGKPRGRVQVPVNLTKALLRIPGLERLAPVSHQALDYLNHMAFYSSRNTDAALSGTGIRCPHFEDYVDNLIAYVRGRAQP